MAQLVIRENVPNLAQGPMRSFAEISQVMQQRGDKGATEKVCRAVHSLAVAKLRKRLREALESYPPYTG